MVNVKKTSEYRVSNYDGSFKSVPEPGLSGTVEVKPDATWQLNLGFRKHVANSFAKAPFQVEPTGEGSSRVTVHDVHDFSFAAHFDLPNTSTKALQDDLVERGYSFDQVMGQANQRREQQKAELTERFSKLNAETQDLLAKIPTARSAPREWWAGITPHRLLLGCHFSGARNSKETGNLEATATGLYYKAVLGTKVTIPWQVIQDIEVSTQSTRRATVGRAVALGVFALAAKKNETFTYVHVSDRNTVWSFAIKAPQGKVLAAMGPVLVAFNNRALPGPQPPQPVPQEASTVPSMPLVADELAKLAKLKADGVLTEEEFSAQKARLLSS